MKLLRNKLFVGIICILLGLIVGFVAIPQVQNSGQDEKTNAIRVKQDIPAGTQLTADMLETVKVPRNALPAGVVSDSYSLFSRYAASQLYAGDYITVSKLADRIEAQDTLALATTKGMKVVSVTLPTLAAGVSGKLQPGDVVTIMTVLKNGNPDNSLGLEPQIPEENGVANETIAEAPQSLLYPELQYVEVCAVSSSDGSTAKVEANPADDSKNTLPVTVSLYVSEGQALRLVDLEQKGIIHMVFVARGKDAATYLPDSKRILNMEVE